MLFFMGASACGLMREALVQQRYQNAQAAARRALRVPMGRVRAGDAAHWESRQPSWETFPCFHLCLTCGYLAESADELCPGCGYRRWTDLRNLSAAEALRQMERRDRLAIPADILWKSRLVAGTLGGVGGTLALLGALAGSMSPVSSFLFGIVAFGAVTFPGSFLASRIWSSARFRRRPAFPSRWRIPLPRGRGKPAQVVSGPATTRADLLRAPVSGRPCLGYELTVLFDAPGDLRPPMWVLEEERNVPFEIDGVRVEANRATFELPKQLVAREDGAVDSQAVAQLLRQRGLFSSEGDYSLHEALLEPGGRYRLEQFEDPPGAAVVIRPDSG